MKTTNRIISIFLVAVIILTMLPLQALAAENVQIAQWNFTAAPTSSTIYATGGICKDKAALNNSMGNTASYSTNNSIYTSGWNDGAGTKYWQINLSTIGYQNIRISFSSYGSSSGPRDFKLQYSTDNSNFTDVTNGDYTNKSSLTLTKSDLVLPSAINNSTAVYLRFLQTSNTSIGNGTVGSGGTSRLSNINIVGDEVPGYTPPSDAAVEAVTANPGTGTKVILGSTVTLSTSTSGAAIEYTLNNNAPQTVNTTSCSITINEFNQAGDTAIIRAKAIKGTDTSSEKTFVYTQAQVEPVMASKTGAIAANTQIKLTTSSDKAKIYYIITRKVGEAAQITDPEDTYSAPVTISADMLPARIEAIAKLDGYKDSTKAVFNYTLDDGTKTEKVYFGQLHSHTTQSDGSGTLAEAYDYAKNVAKLDFFAVTDHSNYFDSTSSPVEYSTSSTNTKWQQGISAAAAAATSDFIAYYGYEMTWTSSVGHINTFNTDGFVSRNNSKYSSSFTGMKNYYELLKTIPGSISQFNHPGKTFGDFNGFSNYDAAIDAQISLVEVGNGEGAIGLGGYFPSYEYYTKALDKGWHLAPTNNQDNHKGLWGTANTGRTAVITDNFTKDGIYAALRDMHVYATEDKNLQIKYTANGQMLGSTLSQGISELNINVELSDKDSTDAIGKVSVITNGGEESDIQNFTSNNAVFTATIKKPANGYYYIKVVEADGDIAVTAPVWVGNVEKVGISNVISSVSMPVTGEPLQISTEIFNNETAPVTIDSIEYKIGEKTIASGKGGQQVAGDGTLKDTITYTPEAAGTVTVDVVVKATLNSTVKTYTQSIALDVRDASKIIDIGVDASHLNDYVAGNYANSMTNFAKLAEEYDVRLVEIKGGITAEKLSGLAAFILTPPNRKSSTGALGEYSAGEIAAIKNYTASGKTLIVCGLADYSDGKNTEKYHAAYQQNQLLQAINSKARLVDDELIDKVNYVPTQNFRLRFKNYNMDSKYNVGVNPEQEYSFYSGSSVLVKESDKSSVSSIVTSHTTSESLDSDNDGKGGTDNPIAKGNIPVLTVETLESGAKVFVAGSVFMSNFEVQAALDNASSLGYSNYNICQNIVKEIAPRTIATIKEVQGAGEGQQFTVQGIVTSNASGFDQSTAFFDCIYVQDSTAGINLFPVSGNYRIGQKVEVTGTVGGYQGEKQLTVKKIDMLDSSINAITPAAISTAAASDDSSRGRLIKVEGIIKSIGTANGKVETIIINDGSGDARVFIDGYINPSVKLEFLKAGDKISAIGLSSVDTLGKRIRVRDRKEICLKTNSDNDSYTSTTQNTAATVPKEAASQSLTDTKVIIKPALDSKTGEATVELSKDITQKLLENTMANKKAGKSAAIEIKAEAVKGAKKVTVQLEKDFLEKITSETAADMKIDTGFATVELGNKALGVINLAAKSTEITISVEPISTAALSEKIKALVEDRPVYDFTIKSGSSEISGLAGEAIKVSIPYTLKEEENKNAIIVYSVGDSGNTVPVTGIYNEATKTVDFITKEFTKYAVAYNYVEFSDINNHWGKDNINFVAAREMFTGVGDKKFGPDQTVTRGMLVTVLGKISNSDIPGNVTFADVNTKKYYSPYIAWAASNGIVNGVGNNRFEPDREVSRQELAVIFNNYIKYMNTKIKNISTVSEFKDDGNISSWAKESVVIMQKLGLVGGRSGNIYDPKGTTTRAELATVLEKYIVNSFQE